MKIENIDSYFGKKIMVKIKGYVAVGVFCGYNYDYDDNGNEFIEFDIMDSTGFACGVDEREVECIKIVEYSVEGRSCTVAPRKFG